MTVPQAPEEVFCMTCGPDAVLRRDRLLAVLQCQRCGDVRHVPALPAFVVTGASGAGKTTVTGPLRRLLPGCEVFEAVPARKLLGPIHLANLDCPGDVLAERLAGRGSTRQRTTACQLSASLSLLLSRL